jgi:hypothetical protein
MSIPTSFFTCHAATAHARDKESTKRFRKHHIFSFCKLHPTSIDMPNPGSGPSKDNDSLRSRTSSNSLADQLVSTHYLPLHTRGLPVRSLLPRRTQQEQREFLAAFLREAVSIIDNDFGEGEDDDSADNGGNRGVSSNSSNYGDNKQ